MGKTHTVTFRPTPTLGALRAELTKLTIGPDDYVVVTVSQPPYLTREQARAIFDQVHEAMPHVDRKHIIVKPASIEIEVKTREEVAAENDIPPWRR